MRAALGGKARGQSFERAADLDGVEHVLLREGPDGEAAGRDGLDEPFLVEPLQRGPDRRARDAGALGDRKLGNALAGRQHAFEDQLADGQQRPDRARLAALRVRRSGEPPTGPLPYAVDGS